jgi:hypothetical protein
MFVPEDAGGGLYRWDSFLREVFEKGQTNPVFTVTVTPRAGDTEGVPVAVRCVAQIDDLLADLRTQLAGKRRSVWITAGCSS